MPLVMAALADSPWSFDEPGREGFLHPTKGGSLP